MERKCAAWVICENAFFFQTARLFLFSADYSFICVMSCGGSGVRAGSEGQGSGLDWTSVSFRRHTHSDMALIDKRLC